MMLRAGASTSIAADQSLAAARAQRLGQGGQRRLQFLVVLPFGHQARAGGQAGDEALGRGHALLFAGVQRQRPFGGAGQRRVDVVDQRHRGGAAVAEVADRLDHVRALARLRDRDGQRVWVLQRRFVQRHQRHRQRGHQAAHARHDQVGEVAGGVVRAAARHRHRVVEIGGAQMRPSSA
jgi:hypothetical protein